MEIHTHAKDEPVVQPEKKKIPFPVNPQRKMDMQNKAELPQRETTATVKNLLLDR